MKPDTAKSRANHRSARRRVAIAISEGRVQCSLWGRPIVAGEKWALPREAGGAFHQRCGFVGGKLGPAASRDW
jgi:hypothetical protein